MEINERQSQRYQFLKRLHDDGNADSHLFFHMQDEIGQSLGFDQSLTHQIVRHLSDEGLIDSRMSGGFIGIMHKGIREVEDAESIPDQAMHYFLPAHTSTSIPAIPIWQRRNFDVNNKKCFVIMPFSNEGYLQSVYTDHTKKIVESFGIECIRADNIFNTQAVMEDFLENMCIAKFLIADLTGRNSNIFYELGIAHTLGKKVILITQNEDDIPFDLRHLRYLKYAFTPPAMKKFEDELKGFIISIMKNT